MAAGCLLLSGLLLRLLLPSLLRVCEPLIKEVIVCSIIRITASVLIAALLILILLVRSLLIRSLLILILLIRSLLIRSLLILILLIRSLLILILLVRSLLILILLVLILLERSLLEWSLLTISAAGARTAGTPISARPALPCILDLPVGLLDFLETLLGIFLFSRILIRVPLFTLFAVRLLQICITAVIPDSQHFERIGYHACPSPFSSLSRMIIPYLTHTPE